MKSRGTSACPWSASRWNTCAAWPQPGARRWLLPPTGDGDRGERGRGARDGRAGGRARAFGRRRRGSAALRRHGAPPETVQVSTGRDALELELARVAHERDLPVLGICRGMQVMNVALGGTLYQDARACGATATDHRQRPPYDVAHQRVDIASGTLLERVLCGGRGRRGDTGLQGRMAGRSRNGKRSDRHALAAGELDAPSGGRPRRARIARVGGERRRDRGGARGSDAPLLPRRAVAPEYLASHLPLFRALIDRHALARSNASLAEPAIPGRSAKTAREPEDPPQRSVANAKAHRSPPLIGPGKGAQHARHFLQGGIFGLLQPIRENVRTKRKSPYENVRT